MSKSYAVKQGKQDNDPESKSHLFEAKGKISLTAIESWIFGLTGLSQSNYGLILGHIDSNWDDNMVLRKYVMIENVFGTS